ncbi:hypothetical protein B0H13DRAFT_2275787 [Mycena leptocephala]|nr:hypothetical protein B0H13DRAFT_2275787 [Mycena leptocephala]
MSFALNGTHIDGGTFNNVSGNMSQVFNSHVVHVEAPPGQRLVDGPSERQHSTSSGGAMIPKRLSRQGSSWPYGIGGRNRSVYYPESSRTASTSDVSAAAKSTPSHHPLHLGDDHRNISTESCGPEPSAEPLHHSLPPLLRIEGPTRATNDSYTSNRTFNSIGGDMTQLNVTSYGESVKSWSLDTSPESTLLWLHGSAGAGKSAIAQMFARDCQSEGQLGASFFFKRGHSKRGSWHSLFPTIAYQLARSVSEFLVPLQQAIESDPLVVGRAMAVQFQRLLVESFTNVAPLQSPPVVVLDGLDECADHKIQQEILRLFIRAIQAHQLPIRLLIASRPEPHIREILETEEAFAISRQCLLPADDSAYEDIRTYLRDEFSRVHAQYTARGIDLGAEWPSKEAIEHLVTKSSGIFIYAVTVVRFVDDEYSHPIDRLAAVLNLDPQSTAPWMICILRSSQSFLRSPRHYVFCMQFGEQPSRVVQTWIRKKSTYF